MHDHHVTYREIELSLGISPTSIHSILSDHLAVKTCRWCIEMLKKYNGGPSKDIYKIVTDDKSWIYVYESETKEQSTMWASEDKPNPTKVVYGKSTSKQMVD